MGGQDKDRGGREYLVASKVVVPQAKRLSRGTV